VACCSSGAEGSFDVTILLWCFCCCPFATRRWRTAAARLRAQQQRRASQLAASNPTLGRRGEGLLSARRRAKLAAGAAADGGDDDEGQEGQQGLLQGRDDLDALAPQVCVEGGGLGLCFHTDLRMRLLEIQTQMV
jgi:hypothetical protein